MIDIYLQTDYSFDLKILSLQELERILSGVEIDRFPNIISIADPGSPLPEILQPGGRNILRIEYDDVYLENVFSINKQLPTDDVVLKILEFAYLNKNSDSILVHCQNGISRSAAAGLILLYLKEKSETAAAQKLFELRPISMPDRYFVQIADNLLGTHLKKVSEELVLNRIISIQDKVNSEIKNQDL